MVCTQLGGEGGWPNACKCVHGERGVVALRAHAFWSQKGLDCMARQLFRCATKPIKCGIFTLAESDFKLKNPDLSSTDSTPK